MAETTIRVPLMQKVAWDVAKDFTYVIMVGAITSSVYTSTDGPFKTWADVVTFAKANRASSHTVHPEPARRCTSA